MKVLNLKCFPAERTFNIITFINAREAKEFLALIAFFRINKYRQAYTTFNKVSHVFSYTYDFILKNLNVCLCEFILIFVHYLCSILLVDSKI